MIATTNLHFALPSKANLNKKVFINGTITLYGYAFQTYSCYELQFNLLIDYHVELISVHSPLLRKSLLVSSPILNDMLKFRM